MSQNKDFAYETLRSGSLDLRCVGRERSLTSDSQGKKPADLEPLNFEFTDLAAAKREGERLPPGVSERRNLDPTYWPTHRRPPSPTDRALTGAAIDWMMALPAAVRPRNLSEQYPRVTNIVAEVWGDPARAAVMIDRLLHDDRGGVRRGFPEDVKKDLAVLLRYLTVQQQRGT